MTTTATKPGLLQRATSALSVLVRGSLPLTEETIARYFGGGSGYSGTDRPSRSYSQVAVVHACVKARSEAIAGMPLTVSTGDDQVIESGPLVELIERPNPNMTRRAFWLATSSILDLFGKCYWIAVLDSLNRPIELYPVSELQLKPITNRSTGELLGWKYRAAGKLAGQEETLPLEQVHIIIDPDFEDPHNPLNSLSPRRAVASAIAQFYKADVANEASLDNGVEPGGALQTDQSLGDDQRRQLKEDLRERHAGVRNRRRFLLLQGGLKWERIGAAFNEMEFSELKKMSRADICAGFSVPGPVVNYYEDSNYAHAEAAEKAFYMNTIIPRAARLAEEWQLAVLDKYEGDRSLAMSEARRSTLERKRSCCRGFIAAQRAAQSMGRKFYTWFDSSGVLAVQLAALAVTDQAVKWFGMGTPLNHLYQAYDVPFPDVPWGNAGYLPIGLAPAGTDPADTIDHPDGAGETDLLEEPTPGSGKSRSVADVATIKATESTRARLWVLWVKSWEPLEEAAHKQLKKHFFELRGQVLGALARVKDQLPLPTGDGERSANFRGRRDLIGSVLFNMEEADKGLIAKMGKLIREGYRLGGSQSMQEAADAKGDTSGGDPFNIKDPHVVEKMRARTVNLKDINRTMQKRVARKLASAIDKGEGYEQIVDTLKEEFNFARTRARTIARTEIGAAVEEARQEGRKQAGVPMKSWLSSKKEHGRPAHAATERETMASPVQNDADFTIAGTGITCQHPRDANLPPSESVNCGCVSISRYEKDSLKAVLGRYATRGFLSYADLVKRDGSNPSRKDATNASQTHAAA